MTAQVSPTRMELLAKRSQLATALQGRDLLKQKRIALVKELMRIVERVMVRSDELERVAAAARHSLATAEAQDGAEAVRSASFAASAEFAVAVEGGNVMGVAVPVIERKSVARSLLDRGYSLIGTSARIDQVAEIFAAEVDLVLEVADQELRLRRLSEEIEKTTRRVNALEHIIIPRLIAERDYIQMVLAEREREDLFRLKRLKLTLLRRKLKVPT